jgi:hypothetical protein
MSESVTLYVDILCTEGTVAVKSLAALSASASDLFCILEDNQRLGFETSTNLWIFQSDPNDF